MSVPLATSSGSVENLNVSTRRAARRAHATLGPPSRSRPPAATPEVVNSNASHHLWMNTEPERGARAIVKALAA
jgi:hypothetical protein